MAKLKPDPLGVPRHPLAVYLLVLAAVSGAAQFVGIVVARTAHLVLPRAVDATWAALLFLGATSALVGMFWQGKDVRTGLTLKRIGMFALAAAGLIYSILLVFAYKTGGLFNAGIVFGFALACGLHYRTVVRRINAIIAASP